MMAHASRTNRPRVLVVDGDPSYALGGSFLRGLQERGYDAHYFDESFWTRTQATGSDALSRRLARRALRLVSGPLMNLALVTRATALRPDVVIVCKGYYVEPQTVDALRRVSGAVTAYFPDDLKNPLNTHRRMLEALPRWDFVFTPRRFAVAELLQDGARQAAHVSFGYDPVRFHPAPAEQRTEELARSAAFVGAYAPERQPPLERLAEAQVPLLVYGNTWHRMGVSAALERCVRGRGAYGEELRAIMTHAAVSLNFVRHGNRDLHVMRSFEVPACAGFMLAERTEEHLALFEEGQEAEFFASPDELLDKARFYLQHPAERDRIARAGHARLLREGHTYADRAEQMVRACLGSAGSRR